MKIKYIFWFSFLSFIILWIYIFSVKETSSDLDLVEASSSSQMRAHDYVNVLNKKLLDKNIISKKTIIENYCEAIFSDDLRRGFQNLTSYYMPDKSIFMHSICSQLDWYSDYFHDDLLRYLKDWYFDEIVDSNITKCDFNTDMNECDFSYMMPIIFSYIIDEYSNIKLANIYWLSKKDLHESIVEFSNTYFWDPDDIWCDWMIYLNRELVEDEDRIHCQHPNTYEYLMSYLVQINQLLQDSKILDGFTILEEDTDQDCRISFDSDIIACSLTNNDFHWENIKNLFLNETMFYNLFLTYYMENSWRPSLLEFWPTSNISWRTQELSIQLIRLENELSISKQSINKTLEILYNVYITFPVHIWLVAYREDMIRFRDEFAKIYTPVYQMYSRFRNVQDTRR